LVSLVWQRLTEGTSSLCQNSRMSFSQSDFCKQRHCWASCSVISSNEGDKYHYIGFYLWLIFFYLHFWSSYIRMDLFYDSINNWCVLLNYQTLQSRTMPSPCLLCNLPSWGGCRVCALTPHGSTDLNLAVSKSFDQLRPSTLPLSKSLLFHWLYIQLCLCVGCFRQTLLCSSYFK